MPAPRPCDTASTRQPAGVARKHAEAKEKKGRMGAQFLVRATSLLSEQCHTSALAVRCTQIGATGSSAPSSSGRSSVLSWCTPEQILSLPVSLPYLFSLFSCIFFPSNSIFTVFFTLSQFPDTPFRLPSNLVFENVGKSCFASNWGIYGCHVANVYIGGNSYVLTTELRNGPERTCGLKLCATLV